MFEYSGSPITGVVIHYVEHPRVTMREEGEKRGLLTIEHLRQVNPQLMF